MAFTVNDVEVIFTPEDRAYREAFGTMVCELDALLGSDTCKAIFGTTPVMASADCAPLWFNLLEGLYSSMAPAERPKDCDAVIMKYRTKRIARKKIS